MNWNDARYGLALARHGTLTAAAAALSTSHTTVARRVQALEDALGSRLFDKREGQYVVTDAGAELVETAERLEAELSGLQTRVRGRDAQLRGELRVATMDILVPRVTPILQGFQSAYPDVDLTLVVGDEKASLERRDADVAVRMTNAPDEHLIGRVVGRVPFAVYAQRGLAARLQKRRKTPAPLERFPWIHWDRRLHMSWLDGWLATHAPAAEIVLRVDVSSSVLHELVASGVGVHHLACHIGDTDDRLVRIADVDDTWTREVWLLHLRELRHQRRLRAFVEHVKRLRPLWG